MTVARSVFAGAALVGLLVSCTAGEVAPSEGTYTLQFPSTAAVVATDSVQVLVFKPNSPEDQNGFCQELIVARRTRPETLTPVLPSSPPANTCELLQGRGPVSVPFGEHALLAIAQRHDANGQLRDFMIGCAFMTIGDGDAPLPIAMKLVSVNDPVPLTTCSTLAEYCAKTCD